MPSQVIKISQPNDELTLDAFEEDDDANDASDNLATFEAQQALDIETLNLRKKGDLSVRLLRFQYGEFLLENATVPVPACLIELAIWSRAINCDLKCAELDIRPLTTAVRPDSAIRVLEHAPHIVEGPKSIKTVSRNISLNPNIDAGGFGGSLGEFSHASTLEREGSRLFTARPCQNGLSCVMTHDRNQKNSTTPKQVVKMLVTHLPGTPFILSFRLSGKIAWSLRPVTSPANDLARAVFHPEQSTNGRRFTTADLQ